MKTIVKYNAVLSAVIVANYGEAILDRAVNASQSAMNDRETVQATQGDVKRGAVKGGISYSANGKLGSKDMAWTEADTIKYAAKQTAPIEMVKLSDALDRLFRSVGEPSEPLNVGIIPVYHRDWLSGIKARMDAKTAVAVGTDGTLQATPEVKPESAPSETTQATVNAKAKSEPVTA
jgi:hypothetical protein